jgi:hypothetical protein
MVIRNFQRALPLGLDYWENPSMRTIVVACLALGAASLGSVHNARAADPYWQSHHEVQWQERKTFKEPEYQKPDWLGEHCIRDWAGKELCRR